MNPACNIWTRHGFVRGLGFFCSLACFTDALARRVRSVGVA
jgi:hypothetical protein